MYIFCSTLAVAHEVETMAATEQEVVVEYLTVAVSDDEEIEVAVILGVSVDAAVLACRAVWPRTEFGLMTAVVGYGVELHVAHRAIFGVAAHAYHIHEGMAAQIIHIVIVALVGEKVHPPVCRPESDVHYIAISVASHRVGIGERRIAVGLLRIVDCHTAQAAAARHGYERSSLSISASAVHFEHRSLTVRYVGQVGSPFEFNARGYAQGAVESVMALGQIDHSTTFGSGTVERILDG